MASEQKSGFVDRVFGWLWRRPPRGTVAAPPLTTEQVLRAEAAAIHNAEFDAEVEAEELYRRLNQAGSPAPAPDLVWFHPAQPAFDVRGNS